MHLEGTQRCTLGSQAQHARSLEDHTRSIPHSTLHTSTHTKHIHNIQQQNNNHTQTYCELIHITYCELFHKQFTNTQHTRRTYILTEQHIKGYNIILTTSQVPEAIQQSKNNNSHGPDKLNIRHLNT